jgi:hypothetical protein
MQTAAEQHKQLILSSNYWETLGKTITLLEPLVKLLRLADGDTPSMGKVHYHAFKVRSQVPAPATVQQRTLVACACLSTPASYQLPACWPSHCCKDA